LRRALLRFAAGFAASKPIEFLIFAAGDDILRGKRPGP